MRVPVMSSQPAGPTPGVIWVDIEGDLWVFDGVDGSWAWDDGEWIHGPADAAAIEREYGPLRQWATPDAAIPGGARKVTLSASVPIGGEPRVARIDIAGPCNAAQPQHDEGPLSAHFREVGAWYTGQAEALYDTLAWALPQGTLDALLAVMCRERASLLQTPTIPEETP
jgi:hypothetical protein